MTQQIAVVDQIVPDFMINATSNVSGKLSDFSGKNVLLFFYPKDNTPVCSSEAKHFRDHIEGFNSLNTVIFGVSRDDIPSHERFKARLALPYELISDPLEVLCNYFDVITMKKFFGKKIRSILRSTFLIDQDRVLRHAWRKIKVSGHVEEVIGALSQNGFCHSSESWNPHS